MTFTFKQVETFRTVYETESVTAAQEKSSRLTVAIRRLPGAAAQFPADIVRTQRLVHRRVQAGDDCGRRAGGRDQRVDMAAEQVRQLGGRGLVGDLAHGCAGLGDEELDADLAGRAGVGGGHGEALGLRAAGVDEALQVAVGRGRIHHDDVGCFSQGPIGAMPRSRS